MNRFRILTHAQWQSRIRKAALGGLAVLLATMVAAGAFGSLRMSHYAHDVAETLKEQCASYDRLVVSDRTKSLFYLSDMTRQLSSNIAEDPSHASDGYLEAYVERARISGALLIDRDLKLKAASNVKLRDGRWTSASFGALFADIVKYPEKVFSERVYIDGEYYDFSAVSREDEPGIVACFYKQPTGLVTDMEDDLESMLTGLSLNFEGNYLVAYEGSVCAASDPGMDKESAKSEALRDTFVSLPDDKRVHLTQCDGWEYLAYHTETNGYSLYVYYPLYVVIFGSLIISGFILILYFVLVFGFMSVRNRALYENQVKLEYANNAKSEFLRRVSHDIRTPVNGARGYIDMAMAHPEDLELQEHCREKVSSSLDSLSLLVNSMLNMSKLEYSDIVIERRSFTIDELMERVETAIKAQAVEKGISYETVGLQDVAARHLVGSPRHAEQVLVNLASNAVKYGRQGGYVRMGVKQLPADGGRMRFEFTCEDNGIGMSTEFQKHMYELFSQEDEGARSEFEGVGLGLPITKKLVDALGGTISCKSRKGEGTCFTVTLEFEIDPEAVEKEKTPVTEESGSSLKGAKVLAVEDNELNMEILEFILTEQGATVVKAWNGQEGVDLFAASAPGSFDLVLMDLMMPVLDGYGAARAIRALERSDAATVPIVAVSANAFSDDMEAGREAGMNGHVSKPVDVGRLLQTVDKLLR